MQKLKLNKSIVGRWATLKWDDIGHQDCIITEIISEGKINKKTQIRVFSPYEGSHRAYVGQIVSLRGYVNAA